MALIVDDSPDVWRSDLRNLCLTRRFVGDMFDDGLQLLASQLQTVHGSFYASAADAAAWGFDDPQRRPPDVRDILGQIRGGELRGCRVAFTGVIPEQAEQTLSAQPLCVLVRLYGGDVTTSVDECSHLVARKKAGWKNSQKIRRASQRCQVPPPRPAARAVPPSDAAPPRVPARPAGGREFQAGLGPLAPRHAVLVAAPARRHLRRPARRTRQGRRPVRSSSRRSINHRRVKAASPGAARRRRGGCATAPTRSAPAPTQAAA
jgi:hypothetical protein